MKKNKENSKKKQQSNINMTPELQEFLDHEEKLKKQNNKMNRPIIAAAYLFGFLVIGLISYIMYFMIEQKDEVIANAANPRLDSFAADVERGDIVTKDGKTIATNNGDSRYYPYDNLFAHAAGFSKYTKAGIELVGNYYLLDSHANPFERLFHTLRDEQKQGDTVVSTLNYELQKKAYDCLSNANGAVVVMEPDTGRILAMVSKPDFNPNDIDAVWEEANREDSTSSVLLNRATQGLYPPGSTFKVLTALAYMRQKPGKYKKYTYDCSSREQIFNGVSVHCYGGKTHGEEDLSDAVANSCNQAFADIGTNLNVGKWRDMLEEFLYNKDLPYNGASATSRFYLDSDSNTGYIPQTAFGQGDTLITPIHNAMIIATIANGGLMMKPYMIDSIENYKGKRIKKFSPSSYGTLMSSKEVETITGYLRKVVTNGTAADYFAGASYEAAGKTGTAEYAGGDHDFSWFIGFADVDHPKVCVSVVVEESDVNGVKAAAVARSLMDTYYNTIEE